MREKVKAVWGNAQHPERVKDWLKSQGARDYIPTESCTYEDCLYFVHPNGDEDFIGRSFAFLFEIVELPRWRAESCDDDYYYVDNDGLICRTFERFTSVDDRRYKFGNYFKTEHDAEEYCYKIKELLQKA